LFNYLSSFVITLQVNHGDPAYIKVENERWTDVNVVGSLLKLFFRKLPEALTTDRLYEALIASIRSTGNHEKSALHLKRMLRELPEQNFVTLRYLVEHLVRISKHQSSNKMDAHNLAMMFGPSLVRPIEESMMNMVKDIDDQSAVIERLILHSDWSVFLKPELTSSTVSVCLSIYLPYLFPPSFLVSY